MSAGLSFNDIVSDAISVVALVVSLVAAYRTMQFQETRKKLDMLLIEKEKNIVLLKKKASLDVRLVSYDDDRQRLKIDNHGPASAKNITIEFPDGNDIVDQSDVKAKFPWESLEANQSVEVIAAQSARSRRKLQVILTWADEERKKNKKEFYVSF